MKPVSGLDGTFLHLETPATPMHVGTLHRFDLPPAYAGDFPDDVRRMLANRMAATPVLRRRLAPVPLNLANPVWVDDGAVDMDYHVRRVRLRRPATQAGLERRVADLHGRLLDRRHPLWMLYVFDGLPPGQAAFYVKIHHAILDGAAGVALARALYDGVVGDLAGGPAAVPDMPAPEQPGTLALAAAAFKHDAAQYVKLIRNLPQAVRTLAGMVRSASGSGEPEAAKESSGGGLTLGPKTPLNVTITGERGFATVSIGLDDVRQFATANDAKINDVVLAICSGALRRHLAHHGGIPRKPLVAAMPISIRAAGNTDYTTQATLVQVNLATHIADPLRRLRAIRDASSAMKSAAHRAKSIIPTDFPSLGMPWLVGGLASLYGRTRLASAIPPLANVVISNVPGPPVVLTAAGARMTGYWPVSIVEHGLGVNITVLSYAGTLGFGITTAAAAVPSARRLAAHVEAAWHELRQCALPTSAPSPPAAGRRSSGGRARKAAKVAA